MSKFKSGDRVRVVNLNPYENGPGEDYAGNMKRQIGKVFTIKRIYEESHDILRYTFEEINYLWDERWLAFVAEELAEYED